MTISTHLKYMEGFKLYVPALLPQHHHHEFEVVWVADVAGHRGEVVAIQ